MRTAWIVVCLIASGCFSEPGIAPADPDTGPSNPSDMGEPPDLAADFSGNADASSGLTMALGEGVARLHPGDELEVTLNVERDGVEGEVSVEAVNLPPGVTATSDGIPAGASDGVLTVAATPAAMTGGPTVATLQASADGAEDSVPLLVVVVGDPGTRDDSFGANGIASLPAAAGDDTVDVVATDDQGRVLVAGRSASASTTGYVIALNGNGRLDRDFGTDGMLTDFGGTSSSVVGGVWLDGFVLNTRIDGTPTLLRVTPGGTIDDEWGTATLAAGAQGPVRSGSQFVLWAGTEVYIFSNSRTPVQRSASGEIAALAADPSGRFIVGQDGTTVITRLTEEGEPDASFGAGGSLQLGGNHAISSLVSSPEGSFAAAIGSSDSIVGHFDHLGELVPGFATAGILTVGTDEPRNVMAIGPGVYVAVDRTPSPAVIHYRADGTRDVGFGSGGEVVLDDAIGAVRLAHDPVGGRLVVAYSVGASVEVQRFWLPEP